jgi:predicted nucleic acid-binding protein
MAIKDSGKVLVDTSAWIDFFRKKEPSYSIVSELLTENRIVSAGIIVAELLQGAKSEKEVAVIKDFIHVFEFLSETPQLWEEAGELSYNMRRKGKTMGLSDCLIAVVTKHYNSSLLTLDTDFVALKKETDLDIYPM